MTTTPLTSTPAAVAHEVLGRLESAWNAGDGAAFGAVYAPDASFVTIRGEHVVGAEAIGAGHAGIFGSIYAGSVNRMELVRAVELADGVVLAVSVNTLDCPTGPLAGRHQAMSTSVVARSAEAAGWHVVSTHNTLVGA
ncbi:SgcJ/EcaC family oxidoreductase [Nocardioides sp.]|uniref:SgcJ/EcaC family oxidoreductase n=1 Tax=Nocardioides sp. TaxID=35761 RepID=UPI003783DFB6